MSTELVGISGLYAGKRAPLVQGRYSIGRDPGNTIQFAEDMSLSRNHAVLFFENDAWYISDLGSTNGTWLDGRQVANKPTVLGHGSRLSFGQQTFFLVLRENLVPPKISVSPPPVQPIPAKEAPKLPVKPHPNGNVKLGSPQNEVANWNGSQCSSTVRGYVIGSPFAYIGERLEIKSAVSRNSFSGGYIEIGGLRGPEEPSLINPQLPVSVELNPESPPYWPQYARLSPGQRAVYLSWLSDERRTKVDQGYLFVWFYGLERRLTASSVDRPSTTEKETIVQELLAVRHRFPELRSFQSYSGSLLKACWLETPSLLTDVSLDSPPMDASDFPWALSCLLTADLPICERVALRWLRGRRREMCRKVLVKRVWSEIESLFVQRFRSRFESGIHLEPTKTRNRFQYNPANWTIGSSIDVQTAHQVAHQKQIIEDLQELADSCASDLESYSRKLGRASANSTDVDKALSLPPELKASHPAFVDVLSKLASNLSEEGSIPGQKLLEIFGMSENPNRNAICDLMACLGDLGYMAEPDPRFGSPKLTSNNPVVLQRCADLSEKIPSSAYAAAHAIASLGCSIAKSDGNHLPEESVALADGLAKGFRLSKHEVGRLHLLIKWLELTNSKLTKRDIERVPEAARGTLAEILLQVVLADGRVAREELAELERIAVILGIDQKALYARLSDGGPITIAPATDSPTFRVPSAGATPQELQIDQDLVDSILDNTVATSALIASIVSEDEETTEVLAVSLHEEATDKSIETVISLLSPGYVAKEEFAKIAAAYGLAPNRAIEDINEYSFERCNDVLISGDDPLEIDEYILDELRNE